MSELLKKLKNHYRNQFTVIHVGIFTCPDTFAASHLNRAVTGAGAVATEAEAKKKQKYCGLSVTYCFIPVAAESTGALGQDATDFLHELGGRIAAATGDPRSSEFLPRNAL